ncbi:MAG TPA: hypothetical protein VKD69_22485 [Vicinamibacterales bacterium]|nr:hypothetical protein [Vicinamibacterales bacterium]
MSQSKSAEAVLAWLWELSDGTSAAVIEHDAAPKWELRVTRHGRIVTRQRCESFTTLMEATVAARQAADGQN